MAQTKAYLVIVLYGDEETFIIFDEKPTPEYIKVHLHKCCYADILDYLLKCVDEGDFMCFEVPSIENTYIRHSDYD